MDLLRGIFGAASNVSVVSQPSNDGRIGTAQEETLPLVAEDALADAQQDPVQTAVVVQTASNNVVSSKQRAVPGALAVSPPASNLQAGFNGGSFNAQDSSSDLKVFIPAQPPSPQPVKQPLPQVPAKQMPTASTASSKTSAVLAGLYGITNLTSVVAIVFANKLVLYTHGFHFAVTLTWLHTIFTALGMMLLASAHIFEVKRVPLARSLPVAAVYVGFIVLNNLSIQLNTVGFYQISKIAITPVVVGIEFFCFSKVPSGRVMASIAVLLTGIALATVTDSQVASRPVGMAVALVNVLVTGLYQVWAGSKQKELGLNGLQLLHQVSPLSVVLLMVLIPFLEPVGFTNPVAGTIMGYQVTPWAGFWIIVSSALGLVVTLSTFLFIGATSSLTYNVVGHLKTVLIVSGGVFIFGDSMTLKKFAGLCTAMSGIVWYSHIKMREQDKAPGKQ